MTTPTQEPSTPTRCRTPGCGRRRVARESLSPGHMDRWLWHRNVMADIRKRIDNYLENSVPFCLGDSMARIRGGNPILEAPRRLAGAAQ